MIAGGTGRTLRGQSQDGGGGGGDGSAGQAGSRGGRRQRRAAGNGCGVRGGCVFLPRYGGGGGRGRRGASAERAGPGLRARGDLHGNGRGPRSVPFRATWGGVGVRRCLSEGKAGERGGQRCVLLGMSSDFGFTLLFFDGLRCSGAVLFRKLLAKPLVAHKALQHRPALCKASREPRLVERGVTGAPLSRGAAGQCLKIRLNGFPKKT